MSESAHTPRRLVHFTPLRYPGGKSKLAAYVKELIRANKLFDGEYVEPYAGGAGIALELLIQEYVSDIHINDLSKPIYSFWKAVFDETEELCRLVRNTPLTISSWDVQKRIFSNPEQHNDVLLGFAAFFLNRTNRSGILNGGVIGGRDQTGPWKIDARYNAEELTFRIQSIAKMRSRVTLTQLDALTLLREGIARWNDKTLIYLDPPYYDRGKDLYYNYYKPCDHTNLSEFISNNMKHNRWIVSYDNASSIKKLYLGHRCLEYNIGYSARQSRLGKEIMFFAPDLIIPPLVGAVQKLEHEAPAA